ncbi:DUF397 domain-containing protein [Actinokineospora spheciospongiae]|uniref:DUF397 domain-containing protein n=1 Tax=Actinokineospora spheciospongiae TaxID=909613 RepID=UPI000D70E056|nr:DUF397 domain-containing protein [Actinokineospora spheciospongiae]PWW65442.1 uncharacterized protein DUF397 [Actinokineospora spheciospongiae]
MSALNLSTARWRKSSRSTDTGNCVELATPSPVAAIRDSKNPDGPALVFPESALPSLLAHVR